MGRTLDLASLVPLARWVTPEAEQRRFDARFFVARAPEGQEASMDEREAIRTFWALPAQLLEEADRGRVTLFPPTHRTLMHLAASGSVDAMIARARSSTLDPICPRFAIDRGSPTLALPGDPLHEIPERRSEGGSRYVLRDDRWVSCDPDGIG
jgi:hypothetical protein